ncbi:PREDICTED: coatomer subunit zeta-2 [Haliaeetus leucocephalus]|uniref:coatomer subunit zeta-2 n=1 Tax=Haliaeetus leucocephalus TaxID=52644 RepID=UPI00053CAF8F|nr:PREDICTED: coatomer subunit zeta-2 [Haliaeetus leucocephalus]
MQQVALQPLDKTCRDLPLRAAGTEAESPSPPAKEPSLYTVKALLILDSLGQRLLAKYYDGTFPTAKEQAAFERNIFSKTHQTGGEIACLEGLTVVYRSSVDLFFYVVGGCQENVLMLSAVLACLLDALSHLLRKEVEKRWLLDNMEGTFLVVDEIVDRGVILESDPQQVIQRLSLRVDDNFLCEQSVSQVKSASLASLMRGWVDQLYPAGRRWGAP